MITKTATLLGMALFPFWGFSDQPGADDRSFFSPKDSCPQNEVTLQIRLDNFGSETTWVLRTPAGEVLFRGGPYADRLAGQRIEESFCLPDGCYQLAVQDSYGDGLCCNYGDGSFRLIDGTGRELATGAKFTKEALADFCVRQTPAEEPACEGQRFFFQLRLDDYGSETSWSLRDSTEQILYSGGPYTDKTGGKLWLDTFCLAEGCYSFTIQDTHGDGIADGGGFTLLTEAGDTLMAGSAFGSEFREAFCVEAGGDRRFPDTCLALDLRIRLIRPHGGEQDQGTYEISEDGRAIVLRQNAWKSVGLTYVVSPRTVLAFEFRSTAEGEIHGIGLDDDDMLSPDRTFRLYGGQAWGIADFADYPGDGSWKLYEIPVGTYFTGPVDRLVVAADQDSGPADGNSFFRNIRLREGDTDCEVPPIVIEDAGVGALRAPRGLTLFPNPADHQLTLRFSAPQPGTGTLLLVNALGQPVYRRDDALDQGENTWSVNLPELPAGLYYLQLLGRGWSETAAFTIQ